MNRKHPQAKCEDCPLKDYTYVPSDGPDGARIVVVSRSPGVHEANAGKPFAGPSGDVLDYLLKQNNVDRKDVKCTNVIMCHTEDKIPKKAIECCKPRLETEINAATTIIAAGAEAVKELTGGSVYQSRGFAMERKNLSNKTQRVVATFNPAIAIRKDDQFPSLVKDFQIALSPKPEPTIPETFWTEDTDVAKKWLKELAASKSVACDIETTGLAHSSRIVAFGVSDDRSRAFTFGRALTTNQHFVYNELRPFLERTDCSYIWHNGKFDVKNLRSKGIMARVDEDTMLLSYVLDERPGVHALEYVLMNELGWPDYEPASVKEFKKKGVTDKWDELYEYNALDCAGTMQLYTLLTERAKGDNVHEVYNTILLPASEALTTAELNGFVFDIEEATRLLNDEVKPKLAKYLFDMRRFLKDDGYNPRSSKQNHHLFYTLWGLCHNTGKTGVDKDVREAILRDEFTVSGIYRKEVKEFTKILDDYAKLDKQRSTYIEGMIPRMQKDGKIYCQFKIHGTETGRLSSSDPNFQNITRAKEGLPNIRSLFKVEPGKKLVQLDYSQAEMRTASIISGDTNLQQVFLDDLDIHAEVARAFFGEGYTYEERVKAKNINFGILFGQSAFSFSKMYHMDQKEAEGIIRAFKRRFPKIPEWTRETYQRIRKEGKLVSAFGRKRRFHIITDSNKEHIYKAGVNFLVQSPASDFNLLSVIEIDKEVNCNVLASVHDSIVIKVDEDRWEDVAKQCREIMVNQPKEQLGWNLPYKADIAIGNNWGELEEVEL